MEEAKKVVAGMDKDSYATEKNQYTHSLNLTLETSDGLKYIVSNEPSNLLTTKVKEGFKVIGVRRDFANKDLYLILTNPETKVGEIGKVTLTKYVDEEGLEPIECRNCPQGYDLGERLEDKEVSEYSYYETLISDACHTDRSKGFGFDINYPIKNIVLKREGTSLKMYIADGLNFSKVINLSNLGMYYKQDISCGEPLPLTCPDINQMRQFREAKSPTIISAGSEMGGTLPEGSYQYFVKYCDKNGNDITEVLSYTTDVKLFDKGTQVRKDTSPKQTNLAIKLQLGKLDTRFSHYKIIVRQSEPSTTSTGGVTFRSFELGIYGTNQTTVIHRGSDRLKEVGDEAIYVGRRYVEITDVNSVVNGTLVHTGITETKTMNLQPVMNFLGQFLKWRTFMGKEDLYENPIASANNIGYQRDEVVPIGIAFTTESGYETQIMPLIGRASVESDLAIVNNADRTSVNESKSDCVGGERKERWEIYNTATVTQHSSAECEERDVDTVEVQEFLEESCNVGEVWFVENGHFKINVDNDYTNLRDYLNFVQAQPDGDCYEYFEDSSPDNICQILHSSFPDSNCDEQDLFPGVVCGDIEKVKEDVVIGDVEGAVETPIERVFPGEYYPIVMPTTSSMFIRGLKWGDRDRMEESSREIMWGILWHTFGVKWGNYANNSTFLQRETINQALTCDYAIEAVFTPNVKQPERETHFNNLFITPYVDEDDKDNHTPFSNKRIRDNSGGEYTYTLDLWPDGYDPYAEEPDETLWGTTKGYFTLVIGGKPMQSSDINDPSTSLTITQAIQSWADKWADEVLEIPIVTGVRFFGSSLRIYTSASLDISEIVPDPFEGELEVLAPEGIGLVGRRANWFRIIPEGHENEFIIDVSGQTDERATVGHDCMVDHYKLQLPYEQRLRFKVSLFKNCKSTQAYYTTTLSWDDSLMIKVIRSGKDIILTDSKGQSETIYGGYSRDGYFLVYDTFAIHRDEIKTVDGRKKGYVTLPTLGSYSVTWRGKEIKQIAVDYDRIGFDKIQYFEAECTYQQPVLDNCGVVPHKSGTFAFWKSTEEYPDNKIMYDSTGLKIKDSLIPDSIKTSFKETFADRVADGYLVLSEDTNFRCKPIRHFKMPDNVVAPIIDDSIRTSFSDTIINVLGVTVDENIINFLLDVAKDNNLIDKKQRDSITGYKLYRGDLTLERTVMASGLLYDTRKYRKGTDEILYPNYPYNTFGDDIFNKISSSNLKIGGNRHTFHSPETDYNTETFGTEISIQGVQFGTSRGKFQEVEEHPKWTILSDRAKKQARKMANGEILAETLLEVAHITSRASTGFFAGMVGGAIIPWGSIAGSAMVAGANYLFDGKRDKYMMEWMRVYENLGTPNNFAYYYHSVGKYNYMFHGLIEGNRLRGLDINKFMPSGVFNVTNHRSSERFVVNNKHREASVLLDTGIPINYSEYGRFQDYDDKGKSSMFRLDKGSYYGNKGESIEVPKNIASMYAYLKNYRPDQHGKVGDINWKYTGYQGDLLEPTMCAKVFGGDTFITRHTLKRKQAQFDLDYMKQADNTPVDYAFYNNVGEDPAYYARFKANHSSLGMTANGEYEYDLKFDNEQVRGKYFVNPSKFYLYYYGIPSFLCESRINTNYRTAGPELRDNFYPQIGDINMWTQQKNVPIDEPNTFNFNSVYLGGGITIPKAVLEDNYDPNDDKNNPYQANMAIYSLPDRDEFGSVDPWLIYRPNNVHYFDSDWGKLRGLKGVENESILGIFDSKSVLFNAVDSSIDMGGGTIAKNYGDGQMFSRRIKDFSTTEVGFGGSQGFHNISTEYGHFHVDNRSGEIYQIAGNSMYDINRMNSSGKPTKMFNWFKNNLPFKILGSGIKGIEELSLDNAFNGIGMTLGYDSRHKRLFITKRDYKARVKNITYSKEEGFMHEGETISLNNSEYFSDVSFTVSYALEGGFWMSFYSFCPDYYVSDKDTFYTGKNEEGKRKGIWIHGATNKSFQVFYQDLYPFELEYPLMAERNVGTQTLQDVSFYLETRKYHNEWDYADVQEMWDSIYIYTREANSGHLKPILANGSIGQLMEYPKTAPDNNSQEILTTKIGESRYSINYFYDRVDRRKKNLPMWIGDENGVGMELNLDLVNFVGRRDVLQPLRSRLPKIRLVQDKESRVFFGMDFSTVSKGPVKP